jgi:beta-lactamase regulating signal transducer with metallopeptidase domain
MELLLHPYAQVLAWALVHFLWQGALIGLVAFGLMRVPRFGAAARYTIGVTALGAMLVAPIATAAYLASGTNAAVARFGQTTIDTSSSLPAGFGASARARDVRTSRADSVPTHESRSRDGSRATGVAIILAIWCAGVMLLSFRLASSWLAVRRLVREATRPVSPEINTLVRRVAGRMALDRVVRVCESSAVFVPVMIGWLKPVVLLPASTISGLAPAQVEALIAHELAHVRRHDYLVNLLQAVVETLLFYHPAVWLVSNHVRTEREHCCDDLAVGVCDRLVYVTALADLAALNAVPRVALAATGGSLLGRVRRILGGGSDNRLPVSGSLSVLFVLLVAGILVPIGLLSARDASSAVTPVAAGQAISGGVTGGLNGGVPRGVSGGVVGGVSGGIQQAAQAQAQASTPAQQGSGSTSTTQTTTRGSGNYVWSSGRDKLAIKWTGAFRLADDDKDIEWIEPGQSVEVSDDGWVFTTGVVLKGKSDGTIERSYRRNGFVRPYDPEGREYLATALLRVVRKSGFGAESRVARFLKQGGIEAVFTEITQLEGDYARRLYYTELFKQAKLSPADLTRVANQAATTISSDYELATLLKAAAKLNVGDENALVALIEATRTLNSDYEHHQALSALVPVKPTTKVASAALASAVNLQSDYERATFLVDFARRGGLTSATKPAFLDLVKGMHSSYEQSRVLQTVMAAPDVPADVVADARKASTSVGSDYEHRQVLMSSMAATSVSPQDAGGVIESAASIRSDNEKANVLVTLAKKGGVTAETAGPFFSVVGGISSPYEQRRVIDTVSSTPKLDDGVLSPLLKAAASVKGDYDRAEILVRVAKNHTLTAVTRPLYLAAADGIRSDYDQTRVLAELVRSEKTIK